jgi:hypothetical protein
MGEGTPKSNPRKSCVLFVLVPERDGIDLGPEGMALRV